MTDSADSALRARCDALGLAISQARMATPAILLMMALVSYMGVESGLVWQPALFMACGCIGGLWRWRKRPDFEVPAAALAAVVVRAERHVQGTMLFSGLTWCFASGLMYPHFSGKDSSLFQVILLTNVSAAAFMSSTIRHSFLLLAVPALTPILGWFLYVERGATALFPFLVPVYVVVMYFAAERLRGITLLAFQRGHEMAQANVELRHAKDEAEAGARAKTRFLATMSHEIRTPLNGLLMALELVARKPLESQQRRLVDLARGSGESLLGVLNDVLDYAKIDADQMSLHAHATDLRELLSAINELFTATAGAKGLELRTVFDPALPSTVLVDAQRLRQVLLNLVGNALKFTHHGEVVLRMRRVAGGMRFEVQDTGIGIDPTAAVDLFKPFKQLHEGNDRSHGGTGLGLAISQRLVLAMGGVIDVDSQYGEGACFGFTLPLALAGQSTADDASTFAEVPSFAPQVLSGRVLVVEDNEVNRVLAVELLEGLQLQVQVAMDGGQALERMRLGGIDVVLMDCQMPGIDGFEATRRWRAREQAEGRSRLPILAVTASALPEDVVRMRAAGIDDVLGKPYTVVQLVQLLRRWLPPQPSK